MEIDLDKILPNLGLSRTEFTGDAIVVTGAGRGIGEQVARAFAYLGGKVVLAELSESGAKVEAAIRSEDGEALFVKTDVSDPASVATLGRTTRQRFGPASILVNNAVFCPVAGVAEMDLANWDQVIAVNLRGTFLTCKEFLPDMLAKKCGTIINMVSPNPMPGLAAYIASKHGMIGFSQCLAQEVGPSGIRVIPFGPGMVDTPAIRSAAVDLAPKLGMTIEQFTSFSLHPAYDGLMPPEHAGAATAYLAARLAQEYHGQVTDGYEILENAGFLKRPEFRSRNSVQQPDHFLPASTAELVQKLETSLKETGAEFGKLPAFIRPMARAGFKSKAGQSLEDWQKTAAILLEEVKVEKPASQPNLIELLGKLNEYYRDVPKETARFTKETDFLEAVAETSRRRMAVIAALVEALGAN